MKRSFRILASLALAAAIIGCSTPMVMNSKSVSKPPQTQPLHRVLIVSNGQLFFDPHLEEFFLPSVNAIKGMLSTHGVESWSMKVKSKSLKPYAQAGKYAKEFGARHVLFYTATEVAHPDRKSGLIERLKPNDSLDKYSLTFLIRDINTNKDVWNGTLNSGPGHSGTQHEIEEIRNRLEEHLIRAGLIKTASR